MTDDVLKPVAERLVDDIDAATALASVLPDDTLRHLAAAIRDEVRGRARASGITTPSSRRRSSRRLVAMVSGRVRG